MIGTWVLVVAVSDWLKSFQGFSDSSKYDVEKTFDVTLTIGQLSHTSSIQIT